MYKILRNLITRYPSLGPMEADIQAAFRMLADCFKRGGRLYVCGNGGSAADALHLVGELMKSFVMPRPVDDGFAKNFSALFPGETAMLDELHGALPAYALVENTALSTAFLNDAEPALLFAQQVYGYVTENDILLGISTSGNSKNIINAVMVAKAKGAAVIGLTGSSGGAMGHLCDICLKAPETETYKIQELHLPIYHALALMLEDEFFCSIPKPVIAKTLNEDQTQEYLNSASFGKNFKYGHSLLASSGGHIAAYCHGCDTPSQMAYEAVRDYNFREGLCCTACGLNARQRMMIYLIKKYGGGNLYIHEQVTPFFRLLQNIPDCSVTGSEYIGDRHEPGKITNGVRHEDITGLSFESNSFNTIVSQDVFEHVPDIHAALREAHRVLCTGGVLLASMPFHGTPQTLRRAELRDGKPVFLHPAEYHGNPMSSKGSLVYYDFGWDLLDWLRDAGFADYGLYFYHSRECGYLGLNNVLIAKKNAGGVSRS